MGDITEEDLRLALVLGVLEEDNGSVRAATERGGLVVELAEAGGVLDEANELALEVLVLEQPHLTLHGASTRSRYRGGGERARRAGREVTHSPLSWKHTQGAGR